MAKKEENAQSNQPQARNVVINAQYVKDLSFENPGAPESLIGNGEAPKIDVSVDIKVNGLEGNSYEVNLIISATAKNGDKTTFVTEVSYAGIFTIDVPAAEKEPVLMIYCPGMLFPYARRIISDATRDGGFPPLMLDPIDFASLYHQHSQKKAANS